MNEGNVCSYKLNFKYIYIEFIELNYIELSTLNSMYIYLKFKKAI